MLFRSDATLPVSHLEKTHYSDLYERPISPSPLHSLNGIWLSSSEARTKWQGGIDTMLCPYSTFINLVLINNSAFRSAFLLPAMDMRDDHHILSLLTTVPKQDNATYLVKLSRRISDVAIKSHLRCVQIWWLARMVGGPFTYGTKYIVTFWLRGHLRPRHFTSVERHYFRATPVVIWAFFSLAMQILPKHYVFSWL